MMCEAIVLSCKEVVTHDLTSFRLYGCRFENYVFSFPASPVLMRFVSKDLSTVYWYCRWIFRMSFPSITSWFIFSNSHKLSKRFLHSLMCGTSARKRKYNRNTNALILITISYRTSTATLNDYSGSSCAPETFFFPFSSAFGSHPPCKSFQTCSLSQQPPRFFRQPPHSTKWKIHPRVKSSVAPVSRWCSR